MANIDPNLSADAASRPSRVGCVSYLNSKPLIENLQDHPGLWIHFDVPSKLIDSLLKNDVDIALCPVIDYFRHQSDLAVVPAGGICSAGQTFTVRLYSRTPLEKITRIHADVDSHTSIVLLQVLMDELFNIKPQLVPYDARQEIAEHHPLIDAPAMLLIGDKVVTDGPSMLDYPHQLDLGQAWNKLTGLPFVFAVWMARQKTPLGDLPALLAKQRELNDPKRDEIARRYAPKHHWPEDLAVRYLCTLLHFKIGQAEISAMQLFAQKASRLGLVPPPSPVVLRSIA